MGAFSTIRIGSFSIQKRNSDGYIDANELLYFWNKTPGNTERKMSKFVKSEGTIQFMKFLSVFVANREHKDLTDISLMNIIPGRRSRHGRRRDIVWMHPYLFVRFAMWLNPKFNVYVIEFLYGDKCGSLQEVIDNSFSTSI